ncbi:MAG: ATP-binding cassette domain-containing protein [Polyangiaceae bacterium]|nr:ATP-binding cassette domain-containing protein [Polyangiaceae bacterium]
MTVAPKKKSRIARAHAPIVVMKNAGRSFGKRVVLNSMNLTVSAGEVVGVVGPNGGGKSTLLLLMAGLLRPTVGSVSVCGIEARALSLTAAGRVGLVTARPGLYPLLTGRENLRHFGGLFGLSPREVDQRAEPLSRALELTSDLEERVGRMSTGMQQKLSLIRALLLSPKLLLFDEPTANLDPFAARGLHAQVRRRADDGLACALVTHDLAAAEAVCDRVLIIDREIKRELAFTERRTPLAGPLLAAWQEAIGAR